MPTLTPPMGFRRGLSDQTCRNMVKRALVSPLGQQALRQSWGVGLVRFIMDWGSTPTKTETIEALKRQANEFMWDLADMRKIRDPDELQRANIRLYEARAQAEQDLTDKYLRS